MAYDGAPDIDHLWPAAQTADPLVSVIIPTHNRPAMLVEALASVRAQLYSNFEVIVVSNGELDPIGTNQIARRFNCHLLTLPEGNRCAARNAAINKAKGRWIAFLDDDDLWHPHKLALQVVFADNSNKGCIFTDFILRLKDGKEVIHRVGPYKDFSIDESFMIWRSGSGGCSTALVRRDALLAIGGFDPNMTLTEDWDTWRRLAHTCGVDYLHEVLSTCRTHGVNGEDHTALRPFKCAYWDAYHAVKTIRECPPHLRHMIPTVIWRCIIKRLVFWMPIHFLAGKALSNSNVRKLRDLLRWTRAVWWRIGEVGLFVALAQSSRLRRWRRDVRP